MVAEIWASVISSFVDQLVALTRCIKIFKKNSIWPISGYGRVIVMDVAYIYTEMPRP